MTGFFVAGVVFARADMFLVVAMFGWPPTDAGYVHLLTRLTLSQLMTLVAVKRLGQLMVLYSIFWFLLPWGQS